MRAFLDAARALPFGTLDDLTNGGGLVVVAPHPDDESLGCGGLLALACDAGVPARLIVLSDGAGSHPNSRRWAHPRLRDLRESETREAAAVLGLAKANIIFMRLPDRHVPSEGPMADAVRGAVANACRAVAAGAVCVTWRHDPHCDHQAAAALLAGARQRIAPARIFEYVIWGWTMPDELETQCVAQGFRVAVDLPHRERKRLAIAAHRSQVTGLIDDDPDGFRLTLEMLVRFDQPYEVFLRAEWNS